MRTMTPIALGATLALTFGLTACTDKPATKPPTTVKNTTTIDTSGISPKLPNVPKVTNAHGALADLTLGSCDTSAGEHTMKGSVTSSAKKTTDYLVTVSWTTDRGDVMGRGFEVLRDLEPGQKKGFTITAKVAKGATQCVKGVSYGTIAK